jgi:prefoldin subunit 5
MDKADFLDIINEYKEQVRVLRAQISELEDACKSKDAALKRSLQKLEYTAQDLDEAQDEIKDAKKTVVTESK